MTWLDVSILGFVGLMVYGGMRRGLILEFFDWMLVSLGGIVALAAYRPAADVLAFVGWSTSAMRGACFVLIFVCVGAVIMIAGLVLDRNYKHTLPRGLNESAGPVLALFKGFLLSYMLVVALTQMPFDDSVRKSMAHAPVVQAVQGGVGGAVESFVITFSSAPVGKDLKAALRGARF